MKILEGREGPCLYLRKFILSSRSRNWDGLISVLLRWLCSVSLLFVRHKCIWPVCLQALAIIYLWIRHFDFKQLPIRLKWSVLFWVPFIFAIMGLFADMVSTLSGQYNYFSPQVLAFISPMAVIDKFMALSPMAIAYGLLNGFYEEFFFLGLLTSVKDKYKWLVLLFSTIVRVSFHTYQGMLWALVIGVVFGLLYYFLYKYKVKNLLPFFLVHALADMFGSSLIYLLVNWNY